MQWMEFGRWASIELGSHPLPSTRQKPDFGPVIQLHPISVFLLSSVFKLC